MKQTVNGKFLLAFQRITFSLVSPQSVPFIIEAIDFTIHLQTCQPLYKAEEHLHGFCTHPLQSLESSVHHS